MSSPIDIPRASSSSAHSSSGSPTGLYVPIHKRVSSSSSPATRPEVLPLRSSNASPSSRRAKRASVTPVLTTSQRSDSHIHIPTPHKIPHIYSTTELLALSASPFVRLASAQRARVQQLLPTMLCEPVAAPSLAPAEKRRRRTGRKTAPSKKLSVKGENDMVAGDGSYMRCLRGRGCRETRTTRWFRRGMEECAGAGGSRMIRRLSCFQWPSGVAGVFFVTLDSREIICAK
ncbi:hypothetical protein A0H81_12212 [Grifola frondosa]|uniref:Uncharacterized protein n=1 Tax=Grifola frondosa TaxID=5627 RepID=A0A1C7LSP4_GRIFR|nr:hypothetical protein A0H81_12212 [Grifola frondosa]